MTNQPLTEVEAMKIVDDALASLEPEARVRVLTWASSKHNVKISKLGGKSDSETHENNNAEPHTGGSLGHIKDFVVRKRPETLYERVTCLAYYLEKAKGITSFKANDIEKSNTDARQGKIDNITQVLNDATRKYDYLAPAGSGKKTLTAKGEAIVDALPDRDKVKEAINKHHRRGHKARKTKK